VYGVIGTDGVVYGPVPVAALFEWIRQGRIVPNTVLIDWQGRHIPASMVPELQGAFPMPQMQPNPYAMPYPVYGPRPKKRSTALWLVFLVGPFGGHRFYLGHTWTGVAMFIIGVLTLPMCAIPTTIWALIDGAQIAAGSFRDSNGQTLA
jgi:TM2 domain-containing membrane protein YozV